MRPSAARTHLFKLGGINDTFVEKICENSSFGTNLQVCEPINSASQRQTDRQRVNYAILLC
jgi:hypothetical protein